MRIHRSPTSVVAWAPAKLNLFFELLHRRDDGYHAIETLMVPVALYDTLRFTPRAAGPVKLHAEWAAAGPGVQTCAVGQLPEPTENLVMRAVELLRRRAGVERGADIQLIKRIPSAAGLGGGSSDAAAALHAANLAWGLGRTTRQLAELSAELGSDIPFFVHALGTRGTASAVCRGRGEQVEPIAQLPPLSVVVVRPPVGLSTAEVYRASRPAEAPRSVRPLMEALTRGAIARAAALMHNALQPAAEGMCDWISRLRYEFDRLDFLGHQLTGSGTSYFGLCRSHRQARQLARRLQCRNLGLVYAVRTAN